jgi:hypothetical protein
LNHGEHGEHGESERRKPISWDADRSTLFPH